MQQYFVNEKIELNKKIETTKEQMHHLKDVLRFNFDNEFVRIVNNEAYFAKVICEENSCFFLPYEKDNESHELSCKVTLVQGLIKKDKWELVLQKATELGANTIVPFESSRTVVKVTDEKNDKKMDRWNKIVLEAAEQCKRDEVPSIKEIIDFKNIKEYKSDINLIAYENEKNKAPKINEVIKDNKAITIVIGPEGGFAQSEVDALVAEGFICVSLGNRILRAETASMYALSVIDTVR